jgi:hypothetical protein
MSNDFLKYINNEKDISRYKISLLERKTNKEYKYRLISIEKDFIDYPFEKDNFKDLEELKYAMSLFKTDRAQFNRKFSNSISEKTKVVSGSQIASLKKKLKYYNDLYKYLLDIKIKEINLLQDEYIKSKLKSTKKYNFEGIDGMAEAEGVNLSKKRARIQILVYCLSRFVYHKKKRIGSFLDNDLSFDLYSDLRSELDNFFADIKNEFFKHYNNGINEVPLLINGTLGHNKFVNTIYPLINIMDKYPDSYCVKRVLNKDKQFFKKNKKPINKKNIQRGFAIKTPVCRTGNESIKLLYMDIRSKSGISINNILDKEFFNINDNGTYYKAIATKPIWTFGECIDNKFLLREVLGLLGMAEDSLVERLDLSNISVLNKINNSYKGKIDICSDSSKMLVAATRSESDHIREACIWIDLLIKEIKDDYKGLFSPTTLEDKDRQDRVERVKEFVE